MTARAGVTFVFGQTETGKTTLVRRELETRTPQGRAIIFDPSLSKSLDGLRELTTRKAARSFLRGEESRGAWIRVARFVDHRDYCWLAGVVPHWRGVTWVLDDAKAMMRYEIIAETAVLAAISGRHMGARTGVELWYVCHRPQHAHPDLRSQVGAVYSFSQTEPRDLALLAEWCGSEFSERVAELGAHEWARWPAQLRVVTRAPVAGSKGASVGG